jgi:hypothetical protein
MRLQESLSAQIQHHHSRRSPPSEGVIVQIIENLSHVRTEGGSVTVGTEGSGTLAIKL